MFEEDSKYTDIIKRVLNDEHIKTHFVKKTSDSERVLHIYDFMVKNQFMPDIISSNKSNVKSEQFRQDGNKAYAKNKEHMEIIKLYNKSIAYAEVKENKNNCLSLAYANRSAQLFDMKFYKECLVDIEYAKKEGYPEHLMFKLKKRSEDAKKLINKSKIFVNESAYPPLSYQPHPTIEGASDCVKIQKSSKFGSHIIATRNIMPGDVIAIEDPFIATLNFDNFYTHCNYCLQRSLNLIPCSECFAVMYCNDECKKADFEKYHKFECALLPTLINLNFKLFWPLSHVIIRARNMFKKLIHGNNVIDECVEENGKKIFKSTYNAIHNLIANTEKRILDDLISKAIISAAMTYLMEKCSDFFEEFDDLKIDQIKLISSELLMFHAQTLQENVYSIVEFVHYMNKQQPRNKPTDIGMGLYAFLSRLNHSCFPNALTFRNGTKSILRAMRPIKKGQQIFDNYGPYYADDDYLHRQITLKIRYLFVCECEACLEYWPTYDGMDIIDWFAKEKLHAVQQLRKKWETAKCQLELPWLFKKAQSLNNTAPTQDLEDVLSVMCSIFLMTGKTYQI